MFIHTHPYPPFFPEKVTKLIVGTLPPPRFTTGELKEEDVNFCYGSISGLLWPVLDTIFKLDLKFENTDKAIAQRKNFLSSRGIGVCDIVAACKREKIDASDLGMQDIELRDVIAYLEKYPNIDTILFTGGNSKNGPEYFFRKLLKEYDLKLSLVDNTIPRIHQVDINEKKDNKESRIIKTISLTAPSGAANRAIGSQSLYKQRKKENPKYTTFDYRVEQYQQFF
ncbi:uracil-DNA glycosylase family protein [Aquimarina rhabdastrellae]